MAKLPLLSGREVVKVFKRLGWEIARQRGSHIILVEWGWGRILRFKILLTSFVFCGMW